MSSPRRDDDNGIDLGRDVPTTPLDVEALRRSRRELPGWFALSPTEFEALVPEGALERRPVIRADARPFTLP